MRIVSGGEPFYFHGSRSGCLLIHGFPGAPLEMRWLGEALHQRGFSVLGLRLSGHATQPDDLLHVHADDWLAGVEDGCHMLRGHCRRILLIGFSLGGVLAATAAATIAPAGLVLLAMPMALPTLAHRLRPVLPLLKHIWRYRQPSGASDWFDKEAEGMNLHYPVQPLQAIGQVYDLVQRLPETLDMLDLPVCLIYSRDDRTVPETQADWAYACLGTTDKRLLWVEGSGHSLLRDAQRERVFAAVGAFAQRTLEAG